MTRTAEAVLCSAELNVPNVPQSGHCLSPGFLPKVLTVNETPKSGHFDDRFWRKLPLVQLGRKVILRPNGDIRHRHGSNSNDV